MKKRAVLGFGIVGLVLAIAAGLWAGFRDTPRQLQRLPDGGTVRLLGVTHPEQPVAYAGAPLPRLLAPFLPYEQREKLGVIQLGAGIMADPVSVWLLHRPVNPPDPQLGPMNRIVGANIGVTLTDDTGAVFSQEARYGNFDEYSSQYTITLPVFPRRGRELTLHLFDLADEHLPKPLARFTIGNPLQRNYPAWKPTPLPAHATAGELGVTLNELMTSLGPRRYGSEFDRYENRLATFGQQQWSSAAFSTTWKGKPTRHWQPEEVWISDATGNSWKPQQLESPPNTPDGKLRFIGNLWNEPAWKLRFRFRQTSGFTAQDVFTTRVTIPKRGSLRPKISHYTVGGLKVEIVEVCGVAEYLEAPRDYETWPTIRVRVSGGPANRVQVLRLGDREASGSAVSAGVFEGGIQEFILPRGTFGLVTLTMAVQRSRDVTFLAQATPQDAPRAAQAAKEHP